MAHQEARLPASAAETHEDDNQLGPILLGQRQLLLIDAPTATSSRRGPGG